MHHYDIDSLDNRDPAMVAAMARLVDRTLRPWLRYRIEGIDRIPEGPALYVANHNGGMLAPEAFLFGSAMFRARGIVDMPYGLGHEVAITMPLLHQIVVPLGAVRASHDNAQALFTRGHKVLVFPGGDQDAFRPFAARDEIRFGGRQGYIRLALRHSVPIVPVVTAGAHATLLILGDAQWLARALGLERRLRLKAFPVALSVPWGLTVGMLPPHLPLPVRVRARVLDPIHFDRSGSAAAEDQAYVDACDARVQAAMQGCLDELAAARRTEGLRASLRRALGA